MMLMDDTVILASSREKCAEKLQILKDFCTSSGMIINESKTKFMAILMAHSKIVFLFV